MVGELANAGPDCGGPRQAVVPGLLPGLAGIGSGLLYVAFPGRLPRILTLEPPPRPIATPRGTVVGYLKVQV